MEIRTGIRITTTSFLGAQDRGWLLLDNYKNPSKALPDMDYFTLYPAPMFEAMYNQHIGPFNSTTTYYGPLMYWLARITDAFKVCEIGMAQGWSSFFMAAGAQDNANRYGCKSMYYGVDVMDKTEFFKAMAARGVAGKFLHKNSLDLKPEDFDPDTGKLELVFIDGWHSTGHVLEELKILRPLLKDAGNGYYVLHDVYDTIEQAFHKVREIYPQDECIRFLMNYGLGIFRVMDNYDYKKVYCPGGPQKPEFPLMPGCFESGEDPTRKGVIV